MSSLSPVVPLGGRLTIATGETTHAKLHEALVGAGSIVLDCSQAEEIDVAFLQLLVSAQRTAVRDGKAIHLAAPPSGVFAEALRRCGFAPAATATALADIFPS